MENADPCRDFVKDVKRIIIKVLFSFPKLSSLSLYLSFLYICVQCSNHWVMQMAKIVVIGFEGWDCCCHRPRWKTCGWKIRDTLWTGNSVYFGVIMCFFCFWGNKNGILSLKCVTLLEINGRLRSWALWVMRLFWCHLVLLVLVAKGSDTESWFIAGKSLTFFVLIFISLEVVELKQ